MHLIVISGVRQCRKQRHDPARLKKGSWSARAPESTASDNQVYVGSGVLILHADCR